MRTENRKNTWRRVLLGLALVVVLHLALEIGGADATLGYTHQVSETHLNTEGRALGGPLLNGEPARCVDVICEGDPEICAAFRAATSCSDDDDAAELTARVAISAARVCGAPGLQAATVNTQVALSLYDTIPGADEAEPDWVPIDTRLLQRDGIVRIPSETAVTQGELDMRFYTFGLSTCHAQRRRIGEAVADAVNAWVADRGPDDADPAAVAQSN